MSKITLATLFHHAMQNGYVPRDKQANNKFIRFVNESVTFEEALAAIPPITYLNRKISNLTVYDLLKLGYHPKSENQFHKIIEFASSKALERLNEEFAIVIVNGKTRVLRERHDSSNYAPSYELMTIQDFKAWCQNITHFKIKKSNKGDGLEAAHVGNEWVLWSDRRNYPNGLVMDPSRPKEFDGCWNIFRGFPIKPQEHDWYMFDSLLLDALCDGDKEHYEWLLDWMASMIQNPSERYGVALVLRGEKGTGKGRFANYFGQLFGPHFVLLSHQDHLTGKFNSHFGQAMLVCADELSWGGDKKREGVLKSMITEDTQLLERKGIDAIPTKNNARFVFTSNENWAVPATPGERRFFVLDVDPCYKGNKNFWDILHYQMTNGGLEGLMHHLMNRKISTNQRMAPHTKALEEIAINGLDESQKWLRSCLSMQGLYCNISNNYGHYLEWPESATADDLYVSYCSHHKAHNRGQPMAKEVFMRRVVKYLHLPSPQRKTVAVGSDFGAKAGKRVQMYDLPGIEEARLIFNRTTGMDFPWLDDVSKTYDDNVGER